MTLDEKQVLLSKLITQCERAATPNGAAYLACICGMWAHTFRIPKKDNPFKGDRYSWFITGWLASERSGDTVK